LSKARERTLFGPDLIKYAEAKVQVSRDNLKLAQTRQKSYHDRGTTPCQYEVSDYVYLKVSPTKGVQRFGMKGILAPRYIRPYEVIEVYGPMAYHIRLPKWFSAIHNIIHVTQLKKGVPVPKTEVITEENAWIEPDFSLNEHPMRVLDRKERKTRRHTVKMYKIQESSHGRRSNLGDGRVSQNQVPGFSAISKL
jgi:hypothetical protein